MVQVLNLQLCNGLLGLFFSVLFYSSDIKPVLLFFTLASKGQEQCLLATCNSIFFNLSPLKSFQLMYFVLEITMSAVCLWSKREKDYRNWGGSSGLSALMYVQVMLPGYPVSPVAMASMRAKVVDWHNQVTRFFSVGFGIFSVDDKAVHQHTISNSCRKCKLSEFCMLKLIVNVSAIVK